MTRTQAKPDYSEAILKHLAEYKRTSLGIEEDGCFFYKTGKKLCPHILPTKHEWLNLLPLFAISIREYLKRRPDIRMHRYFHHLNSSQAFAFNLFLPFFLGRSQPVNATPAVKSTEGGVYAQGRKARTQRRAEGRDVAAMATRRDG
ncbi:MAG TPA: hypothetical protein VHY19_09805 [Steroidobacteraceae bacterium]|nr:hypothetical protein [Steroidobacteraceae bacterium]